MPPKRVRLDKDVFVDKTRSTVIYISTYHYRSVDILEDTWCRHKNLGVSKNKYKAYQQIYLHLWSETGWQEKLENLIIDEIDGVDEVPYMKLMKLIGWTDGDQIEALKHRLNDDEDDLLVHLRKTIDQRYDTWKERLTLLEMVRAEFELVNESWEIERWEI